jgi:hypothetical protein
MTTLSTTLTSLDDPAARAASRVSFQLTYARANDPRVFSAGWLSGPDIPDAYGDAEDTPGEWDGGDAFRDTSQFTEPEWIDRYAGYAINEAIHEALEWLRVDGRCWLDPHGPAEDFIYIQADTLVKKLAELRRTYLADLDETG